MRRKRVEWDGPTLVPGRWLGAAIVVALLSTVVVLPSAAGEAQPGSSESRLDQLERENHELRSRIEALERKRDAATVTGSPAEPAPATEPHDTDGDGLSFRSGPFETNFQFFGDVGFQYEHPEPEDNSNASFVLGSLDTFVTTRIGDSFQALAEPVLEGDSHRDEIQIELERLWGTYAFDDWLYVKLGREHSPLSRWNRKYHHGRLLWPAATQPFLARFEEHEGILPTHLVGVELGGKAFLRSGLVDYVVVVANGRDRQPDEIQNLGDRNNAKAYALAVSFSPHTDMPLTIGANFYADEIPTVPGDPSRADAMRELIGGGFVDFTWGALDLLAEAGFLSHEDRVADRNFDHLVGYLQLNYRVGRFTPYLRHDQRWMELGDPFFVSQDLDLDRWEEVLGLHYQFVEFAKVSLEGGFGGGQRRDAGGNLDKPVMSRATLLLSWGF